MITDEIREKINRGEIYEEELRILIYSFAQTISRTARKLFKRKEIEDDAFIDYFKVETIRSFMGMIPAFFYLYLDLDEKLKEILDLKVLKTITDYAEYHKKRKNLSYHIDRMIFRNLKVKEGEIYVLDTFIVPVDLNKRRNGKKILQGTFDAEFVFDSLKGTTVGYIVAVLINLSNLSLVDVKIFSKKTSKVKIWDEMVIKNLGTLNGKIKAVIADAGFSCYKVYEMSMSYRIVPIVKPKNNLKKLERIIKAMPVNFDWLNSRYSRVFDDLVKDLNEIIKMTLQSISNYEDFAEMRAEIEILFKATKALFGLKDLHIYYRDLAIPRITMCLYAGSLFMQFCMENGLKADVIIEHLRRRRL